MFNEEMLTRNRRRQIEMVEEPGRNVQAAYEGKAEASQLRGELNRVGVEDVGEINDSGLIIVMLEEVKRVVHDLEQERRVSEEMTRKTLKQNQELAKRLDSIESEQKRQRLKIVDLEACLYTLEWRVENSAKDVNSHLEEISGKLGSRVKKLKLYKGDIRREYVEQFAENFEALLVAVEGIDQHIQSMENNYKGKGTDLHEIIQTENCKQEIHSTTKYACQMRLTEEQTLLISKYSGEREKKYSVNEVLQKENVVCQQRCKEHNLTNREDFELYCKSQFSNHQNTMERHLGEAFSAHFGIASRMNRWDDEDKATFLATSLQGTATFVLRNLSIQERRNYKLLVAALTSRFGVTNQSELARGKLKNWVKRKDKMLPELV